MLERVTDHASIAEPIRNLAVPIDSLNPDPANARKHGEKNLASIKSSLAMFGQLKPVIVQRQGMIVRAGNGTMAAAKALGWDTIAAVVIDMDNATASQFAIADNRSAELAEWDDETLASLLSGLDGVTQQALGFDEKDLRELLNGLSPEIAEDEVPEVPKVAASAVGDLWLLDGHRVICGDSTKEDVVARLLGDEKPFLMVTDPPYGVNYDPDWRVQSGLNGEDARGGLVMNDDNASWPASYKLFPGSVAYVWHAGVHAGTVAVDLHANNLLVRGQIIWKKERFAIGRGAYHWGHEPCWYAVRKGATAKWCGDRSQSTVWDIARPQVGEGREDTVTDHGTQKPIECMARPIRNHGAKDDHVYDPFLGSGTTVVACEQLGRRCFGIELDPRYVDVIVQRWQTLTGKTATLEGDGRSFAEVALARGNVA